MKVSRWVFFLLTVAAMTLAAALPVFTKAAPAAPPDTLLEGNDSLRDAAGCWAPPGAGKGVQAAVDAVLSRSSGEYGIYIRELDSGYTLGWNETERFDAASTSKVAIMMCAFREMEAGRLGADEAITYTGADYEPGTGSIQGTAVGSRWTVAQLLEKMIAESDNVAKNMLLRRLGIGTVNAYAQGMGAYSYDLYPNEITPADMGKLLSAIWRQDGFNAESRARMLDLMTGTAYEDRLPRNLEGIPVAHKIGTNGDTTSDVGIVMLEGAPFVISVYVDGVSESEAAATIAEIARVVAIEEILARRQAAPQGGCLNR